jgi:DNA polymerase III beta subunit, N-terminal domain
MEFSVKKFDLLDELSLTQGVVERTTTIPILSNLLFEVQAILCSQRVSETPRLGLHHQP